MLLLTIGNAAAFDAAIYDASGTNPAPIEIPLSIGESINLTFRATLYEPSDIGVFKVTVASLDGLGTSSDIKVNGISTGDAFVPDAGPVTLKGFSVENVNAKTGNKYKVTIRVDLANGISNEETIELGSASRNVNSIPEFPTVALPIASVLGLVYMVRKKK